MCLVYICIATKVDCSSGSSIVRYNMPAKRLLSTPESDNNSSASTKKQHISTNKSTEMDDDISSGIQTFMASNAAKAMFSDLFHEIFSPLIDPLVQNLKTLQKENSELKEIINGLQDRVVKLELEHDELEQNSKNSTIIVVNNWEERREEIPFLMFKNFCNNTLKTEILESDILRCHRTGKNAETASSSNQASISRPLLVKLRSQDLKKDIMAARRSLIKTSKSTRASDFSMDNGDGGETYQDFLDRVGRVKKIFLNDDLTRSRRDIFYEMRLLKRGRKIADCWTVDGKLCLKTRDGLIVKISNSDQLQTYKDLI